MLKFQFFNSKLKLDFPINYAFFGVYFMGTFSLHLYHLYIIDPLAFFSQTYFMVITLCQCFFETFLLILMTAFMQNKFGKKGLYFSSMAAFFLLIAHFIDFSLVRFMDMSIWSAIYFMFQENVGNFLEILYASNVSLFIWVFFALLGVVALSSSIFIYQMTSCWQPLKISYRHAFSFGLALWGFMLVWDLSYQPNPMMSKVDTYLKALPWKTTFFATSSPSIKLANSLKKAASSHEPIVLQTTGRKPDIYLFIIESLREDVITEEISPHLHAFKTRNVHFDLALANANATHISWYSLFNSSYPFYWGNSFEQQKGCTTLRLFKELGYNIQVYSSARLAYYQMGEMLFGEKHSLADTLEKYEEGEPWLRDQLAMESVYQQMKVDPGGRFFVILLDSPHLDYSWPPEMKVPFQDYPPKLNYLKAAISNDVQGIKNRYRNAVFYIDTLFGRFLEVLNASQEGQESLVVVTSDHGEEFYEQGCLFHASHLSHQQTHVPLYYKFGKAHPSAFTYDKTMSCHMDIFPTLLHFLTGQELKHCMQGQSIFSSNRWPYTVIGRYPAACSPTEFCLHNGKEKLIAKFEGDPTQAKKLHILKLLDSCDQNCLLDSHLDKFTGAFNALFGS